MPDTTDGTPSPLPPLYEYRTFLEEGTNWTASWTFSFSNVTFSENESIVGSLTINNATFNVDKSASYDIERQGYYYGLFIELWIYSSTSDTVQFHNRFVGLQLNMT